MSRLGGEDPFDRKLVPNISKSPTQGRATNPKNPLSLARQIIEDSHIRISSRFPGAIVPSLHSA
jgi:hypothetical protein